jgi:PAS domain S-box-containing protein
MQNALSEDQSGDLVELLDGLQISMIAFDQDLALSWLSDSALLMDGRDRSELIGSHVWDLWPRWQNSGLGRVIMEVIAGGGSSTVRHRFIFSGNSFWATARVQRWRSGVAIIIRDLTSQERDDVSRQDILARHQAGASPGNEMLWEWHVAGDRTHFNQAARDLAGEDLSSGHFGMKWWLDRIHADDREQVRRAAADALEKHEIEWGASFRLKVKFGRYVPVILRGFHVYSATGELERILATATDLSAVKEAEERAKQIQNELLHVSSVNAMAAMASTIAHELNQPLTAAANYLGGCNMMLEQPEIDRSLLGTAFDRAKSSIIAAGDIIKGLRQDAFNKGLVKTRIDLRDAINAALLQVMVGVDRDYLTIKMDLPKGLCIMGDAVQMKHALMILMHNAIDSMKGMDDKILELYASDYGQQVILIVADNGPMISVEERAKFFDPFYSTKDRGTGLGFLVSRTIIEEHSGQIWLDESDDIGAKFIIELPLAA